MSVSQEIYSQRQVAKLTGIPRTTLRRRIDEAIASGEPMPGFCGNGYNGNFVAWAKERFAQDIRNACAGNRPIISGVTPDEHFGDASDIWQYVLAQQEKAERRLTERYTQRIEMPKGAPFAIAQLSDIHLGNEYTDYKSLLADCEIIRNTSGMYVGFLGDATDNWIGKLEDIQRKQAIKHSAEYVLCNDIIERLHDKWLYFILGNHGYRTIKAAGVDIVQRMFGNCAMLYDTEEVIFTLTCGSTQWRIKARHDWRKRNRNNPSFAMEDDLRYGYDWDISLGGHVHSGTLLREFICRGKKRYCVSIGCYKKWDRYAVTNNFAPQPASNQGSGALVFAPSGEISFFDNLATASEFLKYLQCKQSLTRK